MRRDISQLIPKIFPVEHLIKICPLETWLFYADGQTDTTKLVVAYRNFSKKPKTYKLNLMLAPNCVIDLLLLLSI